MNKTCASVMIRGKKPSDSWTAFVRQNHFLIFDLFLMPQLPRIQPDTGLVHQSTFARYINFEHSQRYFGEWIWWYISWHNPLGDGGMQKVGRYAHMNQEWLFMSCLSCSSALAMVYLKSLLSDVSSQFMALHLNLCVKWLLKSNPHQTHTSTYGWKAWLRAQFRQG